VSGEFEISVMDPTAQPRRKSPIPGSNEGGRWGPLRVKVENPETTSVAPAVRAAKRSSAHSSAQEAGKL
jgi:hypothetical protein